MNNTQRKAARAGGNSNKTRVNYSTSPSVDNILTRLDKVKPNGTNKWIARCPAHADKSPSLSIKDTGERILLHCFAGCETGDVLAAVGLSWAYVMPPSTEQARAAHRRLKDASRLLRVLEHERLVLSIAANKTGLLTDDDLARIRQAEQRIAKVEGVLHG